MTIAHGTRFGRYQVRSLLGAGGMGEVYLAEDTQLNRSVALKVLPAEVADDKQRIHRFMREAKAVSTLNHPHILTIFEIGETDSNYFIATEFIDGQTLRQRLMDGRMTLSQLLDVAIQVADALAAAHEAEIIHRDIKPENIMLRRRDDYAKVLDFGLAKLSERTTGPVSTSAPTKMVVATNPGVVMGTPQYMSPEQARGQTMDARTDIWSLGCVLYEMVAARPPFVGETTSDVLAAILREEPSPLSLHASEVPEMLEWVVAKTLRKDREERYQTVNELLTDLRSLKQRIDLSAEQKRFASHEPSHQYNSATTLVDEAIDTDREVKANVSTAEAGGASAQTVEPSSLKAARRGKVVAFAVAACVVAALAGALFLAFRYFGRREIPNKTSEAFRRTGVRKITTNGRASNAAISPDGKYIVHVMGSTDQQSLWLRHIETGSDKEILPNKSGGFSYLTFSPDGNFIYYGTNEQTRFPYYRVPVLGGTPQLIIKEDVDSAVSFSPDGKQFAFMRGEPQLGETSLMIVNTDGTNEKKLVTRTPQEFGTPWASPSWSPDGELIVFSLATSEGGKRMLDVWTSSVTDGATKRLTSQRWMSISALTWLRDASGIVVAAADQTNTPSHQIWFVSYPQGEVRRITNDTNNYRGASLTADSKSLVTVETEQVSNIWHAPVSDASRATQITSSRRDGTEGMAYTPDGKILYTSGLGNDTNIWIMNADGSGRKQLTSGAGRNRYPNVSPDGRYIVFISNRTGPHNIWRMDADGSNPKQLTSGSRDDHPSFSHDGRWVVYVTNEGGKQRLRRISVDGGEGLQLTDYTAASPFVSPDGKFIACGFIDEQAQTPSWKAAIIPLEGGAPLKTFNIPMLRTRIQWSADGKSILYFLTSNGVSNIWSQPVDGGAPKQMTDFKTDQIFRYTVSKDGRQLAASRGTITSDVVLISDLK
jgi:serine/threonine protein kinase